MQNCTVAIGFFGLLRTNASIANIKRNVIRSLEHDCSVSVFAHTFSVRKMTNPRSREYNVKIDGRRVTHFNPTGWIVESQERFEPTITEWSGPYDRNTNLNVFRATYSIKRVAQLIQNAEKNRLEAFTFWAFVRPDTWFFEPVRIPDSPIYSEIAVPNFSHNWGVNDRSAIGWREPMIV